MFSLISKADQGNAAPGRCLEARPKARLRPGHGGRPWVGGGDRGAPCQALELGTSARAARRSALFAALFGPYLGNAASHRDGPGLYGKVSARRTRRSRVRRSRAAPGRGASRRRFESGGITCSQQVWGASPPSPRASTCPRLSRRTRRLGGPPRGSARPSTAAHRAPFPAAGPPRPWLWEPGRCENISECQSLRRSRA